jgi:hypothetical protein
MSDKQLVSNKECIISSLLHVSYILPFWTQFGREGATTTRNFRGITSCKIAVILYIIFCEIRFYVVTPELIVHYNAMLSDMIFNKIIFDSSYAYFINQEKLSQENILILDQTTFSDIVGRCDILPVGLYSVSERVIKHYFLIVKFRDIVDFSIISAYGNERIQVGLTESSISYSELLTFVNHVNHVNTGNIEFVRQFILHYFLNNNQECIGELNTYNIPLQLLYFHNLVGQIKNFVSSYKLYTQTSKGGYKKRVHNKAVVIHRHRKSRTQRRRHTTHRRRRRRATRTRRN